MGISVSNLMSCHQFANGHLSFIHNLPKNLATLEKCMGVLKAKRDDVQGRVNKEEFTRHRQRLARVQEWLTSMQNLENEINDLLITSNDELERLSLCGLWSKDVIMSYSYGKKVKMMLSEVESLNSEGDFDVVTEAAGIPLVEELPIQPTTGQEKMLEKAWNCLMEERVGIVGLYGMGGVGKTTLLMQINNEFFKRGGGFDLVIWIVVSKNATVHNIQGSIAKKLDLWKEEWDQKDEKKRALDIHNILKRKKFVLLLDDIWEKVSLTLIGVPYPNIENECKVAFTTRSRDVCGWMRVDDSIEMSCLDEDKAWDLFKERVGKTTLESHPDIPELAKKVAEKCKGLPLALNVIGETMSGKSTIQEWHKAIYDLKTSATYMSGVVDEILLILKYSYDTIKEEQVRSCFLYCSFYPEDALIEKERLIERWIGEKFIYEKKGREWGLNRGYEIIGTLVRVCLLVDDFGCVRMHDVVREMAMWIASDQERRIVQAGLALTEISKSEDWKDVRRISLMKNEIENISHSLNCPELTTLLLQDNNRLVTILGAFFRSMPKLLVLDLSGNERLNGLPEQITSLVSLRYLNLSNTMIKRLPVGLRKLKMLIILDLENTVNLEGLHGISNLSNLRILKLRGSKVWLNLSLMKELQILLHLEFINVSIMASLVGELLKYPRVGRCIQNINIWDKEESIRVLVLPGLDNLREVFIRYCVMWEIQIEKTVCFSYLSSVEIVSCNSLKDLTWLLLAPNLVRLKLWNLKELEEIISKEKVASDLDKETCSSIPFLKLEVLLLSDLPELKSIYWQALPFQRLRRLQIYKNCKKLSKFPLDSKSINSVEEFVIDCYDEEYVKGIQWEDEATQQRFLPSIKH